MIEIKIIADNRASALEFVFINHLIPLIDKDELLSRPPEELRNMTYLGTGGRLEIHDDEGDDRPAIPDYAGQLQILKYERARCKNNLERIEEALERASFGVSFKEEGWVEFMDSIKS